MPHTPLSAAQETALAHVTARAADLSDWCATIFDFGETAWREYRSADKELNQIYARLRGGLDASGKVLLKTAQTRWIGFRDADCEFNAAADKGGLDYQPNYIRCQTERSLQRIGELKRSPFWRD